MNDKPTYKELENQIAELIKQNEILRLNSIANISANEKIYHLLFSNNAFPIMISSLEGKILFINECTKNYFGLDIQNLQNFNSSDLWVSIDKRNEFIAQLKTTNLVQNLESEIYNKNKKIKTVLVSSQIIDYNEQKALLTIFNDITEKKNAEKALYKSNQLLNCTFASLRDAVFILDAKTTAITDCNPAATTIFGYSREEMLGKTTEFIHANFDTLQKFRNYLHPAIAEKGFLFLPEFEMKRKNGTFFPTENTVLPLEDENKEKIGWLSVVRDITDRKKSEKTLQESEERLQTLTSMTSEGLMIHDNGIILDVNLAFTRLFGYSTTEELIGKNAFEVTKMSDKSRTILVDHIRRNSTETYDIEIINLDGKKIPIETKGIEILYKGKKVRLAYMRDITERKWAEKVLRQSEARLSATLSSMNDVVFEIDLNNCFEGYFAPKNKSLYVQSDLFIGKKFDKILPEDVYVLLRQAIESINSGSPYQQFEYPLTIDNSIQWEHAVITPRYNNSNEFVGVTAVCRNITERKLLEDNLKQSEERLSSFINSASDSFYLLDADLNFIEINRKALEFIGKQKIDIIGRNIADIVPDVKSSGRYEKHLEVIKTGNPFTIVDFIPHPVFGDKHVVLESFKVGTGLGVIVYDITLQKKQELELRKLLKSIESTEVSIVITNVDGNIEYSNPFFTQLTGYSKDEYLGKNPKVLKSGIHTDEFYKGMWDTIKSGNTWEGEFCNRKKNGELYWEKSIITPIKNEKEEIVNFIAVKSDITNEKKHKYLIDITLEIYRKSEYLTIEEILKLSIDLGIQLTDSEIGFFHFLNDDHETISLQTWSAKTMDICNVPKLDKHCPISKAGVWVDCFYQRKPVFHNDYSSLSHKKGLPEGHATITSDLSVPIIIENQVVAIFGVGNKKSDYNEIDAEFLSIFTDNVWNIIRRKNAESDAIKAKEKAEESDRLKTAFLTNMSHEIRTPMNGILGFAELLKEPNLSTDDLQDFIKTIQISGDRMLETINDIVDISKIESGLINLVIDETNINKKIEFTYKFFKPEVERKGLQFMFKNGLQTKDAVIRTDNEKVYSIMTNLVKNAVKFTYDGSIEFGYEKKGEYLEFYVKDSGVGINVKQKEFIFERFRQGDTGLNRLYEGSGLGLAIAKSYVEMLGGKIWVESEEGKGSTFYFTIPYHSVEEVKTEIKDVDSSEIKKVQSKKLKILIVEDDEVSYSFLKRTVQKIGKEVLHAITGVEAIEACRSNPDLDLVLMDIRMPIMDGNEATRQIRQFNKDVIIIAQTAYAFAGDSEKAIEAGCNDYISKPVNMTLLFELIKKHINKK